MLLKFKKWFPKIKKSAWIAPSADIIGDVKIGANSSVWFGTVIRGDVHKIRIGKRTSIQDLSMIHVTHYKKANGSDGNPTIIGDDVTIGHKVMLHGCTIEDCCLIGMSATILDGAVIGRGSIVGAHSLVTSNKIFPPYSLIMGSPAKVVRTLSKKARSIGGHFLYLFSVFYAQCPISMRVAIKLCFYTENNSEIGRSKHFFRRTGGARFAVIEQSKLIAVASRQTEVMDSNDSGHLLFFD